MQQMPSWKRGSDFDVDDVDWHEACKERKKKTFKSSKLDLNQAVQSDIECELSLAVKLSESGSDKIGSQASEVSTERSFDSTLTTIGFPTARLSPVPPV